MPSVNIAPYLKNQYFDDNGEPLAGGLLYTKAAGTEDDKSTYMDADGTTENANPIVLDSSGRLSLYLESGAYDFVLKDSSGNTIWTEEDVTTSTSAINVDSVSDMRDIPITGDLTIVRTLGYYEANDGGGWWYYWDSTSTEVHDGGMIVSPTGLPASGRWIGFMPPSGEMNPRIFGAKCDGTTDDVSEIQACDTWCAANDCIIALDGDTYVTTDPSLTCKIKLLPGVLLKWGAFNPTLDVIIDGNDKTRHFTCISSFVPTLNVNELYPEWFGNTAITDAVTAAAIAAISNQKTKLIRTVELIDASYLSFADANQYIIRVGGSNNTGIYYSTTYNTLQLRDGGTQKGEISLSSGDFQIDGTAYIDTDVHIGNDLILTGDADINTNADINGTLDSHGAVHFYSTLEIDDNVKIADDKYIGIDSDTDLLQLKDGNFRILGYETITGNSSVQGDSRFNIVIADTTSYAEGVGGGILFMGRYNSADNSAYFGGIKSYKANGVDGDYATELHFQTSNNSLPDTRMILGATGNLQIDGTIICTEADIEGNVDINGTLDVNTGAHIASNFMRLTQRTVTTGSTGTAGDICWDGNYIYICSATNTWKRVAVATW